MRLRRLVLIALTIGVTLVMVVPSLLQFTANHYLPTLQDELEKRGVRLSVVNISGHLLGVSADSVELWFSIPAGPRGQRIPAVLELQNVSASLEPSLPPRVRLRSNAYNGSVDLSIRDLSSAPRLQGDLKEIDLGAHPQLHALGLTRAVTTIAIVDMPISLDPQATARVELKLSEGSFSLSPKLIELVGDAAQQVASLIKIDQVSNLNLRLTAAMEQGAFSARPIQLESSLAALDGQVKGSFDNGRGEPTLGGNLRVKLTEESDALRGWLPLVSENTVAADASSFSARFSSTSCSNISVPIIRMGRLCVRGSIAP